MNFTFVSRHQKCFRNSPATSKMRVNFIKRLICDNTVFFRSKRLWILVIVLAIIAWRSKSVDLSPETDSKYRCCEPIDAVYTWVNGSDPDFLESITKYTSNFDPARFDDKNELKYSLRSLEKFAPWIRHVFLVTNGQIPHWLNLASERITVITHSQIAPIGTALPTFSSSAIETFIHRIPNLSKRFLYLNDDIFLGAKLYPEDLYTESDGVKVYMAWTVPDCSLGCPWVYIGDGSCDDICNVEECQFDGGDCDDHSEYLHKLAFFTSNTPQVVYEVAKISKQNKTSLSHKHSTSKLKKSQKFNELLKNNVSNDTALKSLVEQFNQNQKTNRAKTTSTTEAMHTVSSQDIYAQNLIHTNKMFNKVFGYRSRKVLAHVGFLLDREIIEDMIKRFRKEFDITASHRIRHHSDIQFAFAYYHFLMNQSLNLTASEIFDELDTDGSSTWSDREIRTLLTRIYPLPLDWAIVRFFEQIVINCSKEIGDDENANKAYTTLVYERYEDSTIPKVTKHLVLNCPQLVEALETNFAERSKYRFHVNQKTGMYSNFKMLLSNMTEVVDSLDELRKNPKKFNCINDNLDPSNSEENHFIKLILEDFYLSFFPQPSEFELPDNLRNRFTQMDDYLQWKQDKELTILILYIFSAILCAIGFKYFCCHKAKYARKFIPYKCCDI